QVARAEAEPQPAGGAPDAADGGGRGVPGERDLAQLEEGGALDVRGGVARQPVAEAGRAAGVPVGRVGVGVVEQPGEVDDAAPFLPVEKEGEAEIAPGQPVAEVDDEVRLGVAD